MPLTPNHYPMEPGERRWRVLEVSPQCLGDLLAALAGTRNITITGWPEDAKVTGFNHDFYRDVILLRVESETFEVVPPGAYAAPLEVLIHTHTPVEAN